MQSQAQREEKTVVIATGLSLFVVILALGGAAGWALNAVVDPGDRVNGVLGLLVWSAAIVVPFVYVRRSRA